MANEASSSLHQSTDDSVESTVKINIKTLESHNYTFRVEKSMPVLALKEKLANETGVPVELQRLIFRGKVLQNDHLLSEYNLEDGHTLHLVARQPALEHPSSGTGSNQGNDSTSGAPRNTMRHSVVLGPVTMGNPGEIMGADIGRLIGEALSSLGFRPPAPDGTASSMPSATGSNQVPANAEREGTQNGTDRAASGIPPPPRFITLSHPFQSVHQIPQFATTGTLPRNMVIPDSLATLSEFISQMELVLQNGGSPSPQPSNTRDRPHSPNPPLDGRGLPTPETLASVMERVQQLLGHNATAALSHVATRLIRERTLTDPVERGQIQSDAMHVGVAMQHLGAMLLELGRTISTLRMGQSPAESAINAGPAVYISGTGPNPMMVQPFPLHTNSLFGVPSSPLIGGTSTPIVPGDPSRNINIHIRGGNSVLSGASSVRGEGQVSEPASNNTGSTDSASTRGFPLRTVVAAIPAHGTSESAGHVLNIVYPVHVTTQQLAVPIQSATPISFRSPLSSGAQPNMMTPVSQTSVEPTAIPSLVGPIHTQLANAFPRNAQGSTSSFSSGRSSETQGARPISSSETQPDLISLSSQTLPTPISVQLPSGTTRGQTSFSTVQSSDILCAREGSQLDSTELSSDLGEDNVHSRAQNEVGADNIESSASVKPSVIVTSMPGIEGRQLEQESLHCSLNTDSRQSPGREDDLKENSAIVHTNPLSKASESEKPAPLGLGPRGLQPKRRIMQAKPVRKDQVLLHEKPSTSQNQQSTSKGQQFLNSLSSQSSGVDAVNINGSHSPLPTEQEGGTGQVDAADMMSNILQSPIFNNLLTGVAAQTGIGSSTDLRSIFGQVIRSPALGNALNEIVEQVEGQTQDTGPMLSGIGRGRGGLDLSRMIQQMMPAVSQALGRASARPTTNPGLQPEHQLQDTGSMLSGVGRGRGGLDLSRMIQQMMPAVSQALGGVSAESATIPGMQPEHTPRCNDDTTGRDERNSKVGLQQAVERIEHHDSPREIFRAVLESASDFYGEVNSAELVSELADNEELINEFMNMLVDDLHRRVQADHPSED